MDIEGAEYEVFLEISEETLKKFRIMVVEFHHLDLMFGEIFFGQLNTIFQKISKYFHVVHIHPNNIARIVKRRSVEIPEIMEFTFIRKDRIRYVGGDLAYPHPLDSNNVSTKSTVILPDCWWK